MNDVLITGIGIVSSIGVGLEEAMTSMFNQPPAAKDVGYGGYGFPIENNRHEAYAPKKLLRKMDRFSKFHAAAVSLALEHANLKDDERVDKNHLGLLFDTGFGSAATVTSIMNDLLGPDPLVSPLLFPNVVANAGSAQACISFGLRGNSSTMGGLGSLMYAFDLIRMGKADRLIVGGADEMIPLFTRSMVTHGVINEHIPVGEGAVALVLESAQAATERGAVALAKIGGVAVATDPGFQPLGEHAFHGGGLDQTVREVLQDKQPSLVISCANGSPHLEQKEKAAVGADTLHTASIISPKRWTGEVFGMGSALSVAVGAMALAVDRISTTSLKEVAAASSGFPQTIPAIDPTEALCLANAYDATRGQAMSIILLPV